MTSEWDADRLDLPAYLRRVGYAGPLGSDERTLTELHRAHVRTIPFENIDIVLGKGVSVDLDAVQAKLVDRCRGGYCFEHGLLFGAVLERLGYAVDRILARVGADERRPKPRTHMALRVRAGGKAWLADVGFGSGLLEPMPWGATDPRRQGGWVYRLVSGRRGVWQLQERDSDDAASAEKRASAVLPAASAEKRASTVLPAASAEKRASAGKNWTALFSFTEDYQHASDVMVANHFTASNPSSPFVGRLVVMSRDVDCRRRLVGRRLAYLEPGKPGHERRLTDTGIVDALRTEFGLSLSKTDNRALLSILADARNDV